MTKADAYSSPDFLRAQSEVERAGRAWVCRYSSSAEFEAAVIRARRRVGAFRAVRRLYWFYAATTTGTLVAIAQLFDYFVR
jgi:hypothetical protein